MTTGLKEAILEAAEMRGRLIAGTATQEDLDDMSGKARFLLETTDPAGKNLSAFMPLLGKVLPLTVAGDPDAPIQTNLTVEFVDTSS